MADDPHADTGAELREQHATTWRDAWRGLPDNPLANLWLLSAARRMKSASTLRRNPALSVGLIAGGLTLVMVVGIAIDQTGWGGSLDYGWLWLGPYVGLLAAWLIALLGGITSAVRGAADLLRRARGQADRAPLDDNIVITPLSDHEIAIAALRVILPQLWWPVFGGAWLYWLHIFLIAAEPQPSRFWLLDNLSQDAVLALLSAPVTIGLMTASGLLAGLIVVLFYLCVGREGGAAATAGAGALIFFLAQVQWGWISTALSWVGLTEFTLQIRESDPTTWLIWALAALTMPLLPVLLLWLATFLGRQAQWLRLTLVVGGPLLLPFVMQFTLAILAMTFGSVLERYLHLESKMFAIFEYVRAWGLLLPFNPLILPPDLVRPGLLLEPLSVPRAMCYLHIVGLVGAQLLAIKLLAREVLLAIHARRQSAVTL